MAAKYLLEAQIGKKELHQETKDTQRVVSKQGVSFLKRCGRYKRKEKNSDEEKRMMKKYLVLKITYTDQGEISTDKEKVSTDRPIVSTDGSKVSTDRQIEDDETIAKVLLNMSRAKAVSREKEKDKGKKKIEEEDESKSESNGIPEAEKKFKQLASDEEMARKMQKEWKENDELRLHLTIALDEEKEVDYEILDRKYPIKEWKTECLGTKPQVDKAEHLEEINQNVVIRSNGQKRYFSTLMRVLSIFDRDDLNALYQLVMDKYQDEILGGFDKVRWGDLMVMFNPDDEDRFWNSQQD
ncbi:hypothetical protein Tco_0921957 [Tanacetum coccineum]|uniref:Uncharacterized protein n=1 Tax=Tanacetum coccineum TaxID=301880 RepID=A0ABQ5CXU3_9ASTR